MANWKPPSLHESIEEMITAYHEVNGPIEVYHSDPSDSVYARYILKNRPFIVRNGCSSWPATRWNASYLRDKMVGRSVKVAETPLGNADAVVIRPEDGHRYFVKPFEKDQPFSNFLSDLQEAASETALKPVLVKYSQGQNDNMRAEYLPLLADVPKSIQKISQHLGTEPDAINFWLGNSASTTSLHRDNYENFYAQIKGAKNFVLIPPVETACVNEQFLPTADYAGPGEWLVVPDHPEMKVPVAVWDPDRPEESGTQFSRLSKPYRVRLGEGDVLYLPACWYHKVSQENSSEGICCSVNYWYDMEFDGGLHCSDTFIRNMAWAATHRESDDLNISLDVTPKY